jgi:ABC-2 type transporter
MTPEEASKNKETHVGSDKDLIKIAAKAPESSDNGLQVIGDYLASLWNDAIYGIGDIIWEFFEWIAGFFNFVTFKVDPIRQTCRIHTQLWLLIVRSTQQTFGNPRGLIADIIINFLTGYCIALSNQNFDYLGANPPEVCLLAPWNLKGQCLRPIDYLREAGLFLSLGTLFSGISAGLITFGRERVVFWRDTASGMNTLPYYVAKNLVDIPRIVLGATSFTLSFIVFYRFRQDFFSLYALILVMYFVAFGMGYWISIIVPPQKSNIVAVAFALLWALVLSGVFPSLDKIYAVDSVYPVFLRWLWGISAPRWAIEYFWIREVNARAFVEKYQDPPNRYRWDRCKCAFLLKFYQ